MQLSHQCQREVWSYLMCHPVSGNWENNKDRLSWNSRSMATPAPPWSFYKGSCSYIKDRSQCFVTAFNPAIAIAPLGGRDLTSHVRANPTPIQCFFFSFLWLCIQFRLRWNCGHCGTITRRVLCQFQNTLRDTLSYHFQCQILLNHFYFCLQIGG